MLSSGGEQPSQGPSRPSTAKRSTPTKPTFAKFKDGGPWSLLKYFNSSRNADHLDMQNGPLRLLSTLVISTKDLVQPGGEGYNFEPASLSTPMVTQPISSSSKRKEPMEFDLHEKEAMNLSDEDTVIHLSQETQLGSDSIGEVEGSSAGVILVPKKRLCEASRRFQDTWAAKLPWAELVVGDGSPVHNVKCVICSTMLRRPKFLHPKWDTLTKHAGWRKAVKDMRGVAKKGEFYYSKDCAHAKNAILYASRQQ